MEEEVGPRHGQRGGGRLRRYTILIVGAAIGLFLGACGAGDGVGDPKDSAAGTTDSATDDSATEGDATDDSATEGDATGEGDEQGTGGRAEADRATEVAPDDTPALEAVYDDPPSDGGWPVAAGAWSSSSFSESIRFELPTDVTLLADGLGRLEFRVGPSEAPHGWIHVVEPIAIASPTGPIPIDLISAEDAFATADVSAVSELDTPLGVASRFDFTLGASAAMEPFLSGCFRQRGLRCIEPFVTASATGPVRLAIDRPHRLVSVPFGEEGRLMVVASPADSTDELFLEHADAIAATLGTSTTTWGGTASLDRLGRDAETIPAGRWVRPIGATLLTVDVETEVDIEPLLYPEIDAMGLGVEAGSVFLNHFDLGYDLETGLLESGAGRWSPPTRQDLEAAVAEAGGTVELVEVEYAGHSAVTIETDFPDAASCPPLVVPVPAEAMCISWFRSARSEWLSIQSEAIDEAEIYIPELGILLGAESRSPAVSAESMLWDLEAIIELAALD